ncbi:MAG: AMP-binding protein, partial [Pseudomonadales bacterium]
MSQHKAQYDAAVQQITASGAPFEVIDRVINGVTYKCYKNAPRNLPELFAPGLEFGDKEFLIYEGERWTFAQFFQQAASIGHQLVNAYGVKKGDRIALAMRNYPEWMTAFVAVTSVGAVAVPLNSLGQAKELEYGLTDAGASIVICDQQRLDHI